MDVVVAEERRARTDNVPMPRESKNEDRRSKTV